MVSLQIRNMEPTIDTVETQGLKNEDSFESSPNSNDNNAQGPVDGDATEDEEVKMNCIDGQQDPDWSSDEEDDDCAEREKEER